MKKLCPGGRLVINAIRKEDATKSLLSQLPRAPLDGTGNQDRGEYDLQDIAEFLPLAGAIPMGPEVTRFPLEQANEALQNLRQGGIRGANVLIIDR